MTVLVLYAGGTIGMESTSSGYQPMQGFEAFLQAQMSMRTGHPIPEFDFISFENLIDSSNLMPSDWTHIGHSLLENWDKYEGFILLHGTDTMAYTASMLSFMLQGCDKPVIVTGSQIPMTEARNDAIDNLISSLILAGTPSISEVCIYFNGLLVRGSRATKVSSQDLDAFDSPNYPRIGKVGINVELKKHLLLPQGKPLFTVPNFDPSAVAIIHTYPGMQSSVLEALLNNQSLRGLVLCTYGAGNPPAANRDFMSALQVANDRDICIVNISQCLKGGVTQGAYATGSALGKVGVISGNDMTLEAAFTKLHFLLASNLATEHVKKYMMTALCGESTVV
ncbi:type I asparaginase [Leucothrix arctica]|uniref:asparaginase n=1 Tax=Leucothrix arctica TaxID=1481894 RepID=A0A317CDQ1_9GAMM|nr:type I asparaginase [Leucothrix arctica]PWQ94252.1 L-asparaginase 1 [Leucothrix arctica]